MPGVIPSFEATTLFATREIINRTLLTYLMSVFTGALPHGIRSFTTVGSENQSQ